MNRTKDFRKKKLIFNITDRIVIQSIRPIWTEMLILETILSGKRPFLERCCIVIKFTFIITDLSTISDIFVNKNKIQFNTHEEFYWKRYFNRIEYVFELYILFINH